MKAGAISRLVSFALIALMTSLGFSGSQLAAVEQSVAAPSTGTLSYVRLYTSSDGVSHFSDEKLQLNAAGAKGTAALLAIHRLGDVKGAQFAMLKSGTTETWHTAPRRQFMLEMGRSEP